jgi:hypothetical protein
VLVVVVFFFLQIRRAYEMTTPPTTSTVAKEPRKNSQPRVLLGRLLLLELLELLELLGLLELDVLLVDSLSGEEAEVVRVAGSTEIELAELMRPAAVARVPNVLENALACTLLLIWLAGIMDTLALALLLALTVTTRVSTLLLLLPAVLAVLFRVARPTPSASTLRTSATMTLIRSRSSAARGAATSINLISNDTSTNSVAVGALVGALVGTAVGALVGTAVGALVGAAVGTLALPRVLSLTTSNTPCARRRWWSPPSQFDAVDIFASSAPLLPELPPT